MSGRQRQSYLLCLSHTFCVILDLFYDARVKSWQVNIQLTCFDLFYCKEIQPVHPKGDQSWVFIGRTDAKSWLIWKDPDAGKEWRQEEKGMTEDEMVQWHQWLNGHEFKQPPGDGEGQGSLVCCSLWGCKESDMTERLNNNVLKA